MMNPFDEIRSAIDQAKATLAAADSVANTMASLLCSRLRNVSPWVLKVLKHEIAEFNSHTKKWKS